MGTVLDSGAEARILELFRVEGLREGQRALIEAALAGENSLGVLPTGHGKSLCYQAAAVLLGGTSVVVSPLIALMRDQVQSLQQKGIAAHRFDSTLEQEVREALLADIAAGRVTLLFVAPESLESPALQQALARTRLSLFVVDEAHCVSQWGHSFRPDYLRLPRYFQRSGFRSVMALTATATTRVQTDLCQAFHIPPERVAALSPHRINIHRAAITPEDRDAALVEFLNVPDHRPAIVYARTRKGVEALAARLAQAGFASACYHAGMPTEVREQIQDAFLTNGKDVLVATIAFGMGIDKPDVRSVVHYDVPSSPEAYLQESGRAGRDGQPAQSLVLLNGSDLTDARNRIRAAEPDTEGVLRAVRWLLPAGERVVSLWELGTTCDVADDVAQRALAQLQDAGAVEITGRGYKFYKVRPLYPLSTICDGRDKAETARLQWLDKHREGEVEEAALAWDCSPAEVMDQLRECEAAGEWKLTLRQQALFLRSLPGSQVQAREIAGDLSAAYAARREADSARLETLLGMLTSPRCLNDALEEYFTDTPMPPCGHCSACTGRIPPLPWPPAPSELPPLTDMPELDRDNQRKRFLLGLASPGLTARRLWAHPLYGVASGTPWDEV